MTVQTSEPTTDTEDVPKKRETSSGVLYRPQPRGRQLVCLVVVVLAGPGIAWTLARGLGLSENARMLLLVPFVAIAFLGYVVWTARLQALAFSVLGKGLARALWRLVVRRRKPENIDDILPAREELERTAVRGQAAASSFCLVSFPVALVCGAGAALLDSPIGLATRIAVLVAACLVWGAVLSFLGRRGYLPILEGE